MSKHDVANVMIFMHLWANLHFFSFQKSAKFPGLNTCLCLELSSIFVENRKMDTWCCASTVSILHNEKLVNIATPVMSVDCHRLCTFIYSKSQSAFVSASFSIQYFVYLWTKVQLLEKTVKIIKRERETKGKGCEVNQEHARLGTLHVGRGKRRIIVKIVLR